MPKSNTAVQTVDKSDVANLKDVIETKKVETTKDVFEGLKYDELLTTHKTKSAMIRYLASLFPTDKADRGKIAKFMGIKYQFVRNVLVTPIGKKSD